MANDSQKDKKRRGRQWKKWTDAVSEIICAIDILDKVARKKIFDCA